MFEPKSRGHKNLVVASGRGYYVGTSGDAYSFTGKKLKLSLSGRGTCYYYFSMRRSEVNRSEPIRVHQLQAYQKFGNAMFEPGIMVRHLNGDNTDNSHGNIDIGTGSENSMDRPPGERILNVRRKLTMSQAEELRIDRDNGMTYRLITQKYGISYSAIRKIVSYESYIH